MRQPVKSVILSVVLLALTVPVPATAQGALKIHDTADTAVMAAGAAVWAAGEFFKEDLAPETCRWCATNDLDEGVRSAVRWDSHRSWAARGSDFALGSLVLTAGLMAQYRSEETGDGLAGGMVVLESVAVSALINQVVKFSVGRQRPYVRTLEDPDSVSRDRNLSFYSGHTSTAFAAAVAGAWAYQLEDGPHPEFMWAGLLSGALLVGYLRIAADKHYFTDVLTGAIIGSAVAWGTVRMHKSSSPRDDSPQPYAMFIPSHMLMIGFTMAF